MKIRIKAVFLVAAAAFASNVFGQGQVTLGNNANSLITFYGLPVAIGSASFQLYYAPLGTPLGSLVPVGPVVGTSLTVPGRIQNTVIDIPTAVIPAGSAAWFQVRGWTPTSYPTYESNPGDRNASDIFMAFTSPNVQPSPLPTSLNGLYSGFDIGFVPEPSTFALAGLGLVSLLLLRHRK